jgi:hypothetical protein
MGEQVQVESIDALKKFRAALCKFAEVVKVGLDEAEAEIQRTSFWLKQEQHSYWKRQVEKRAEIYARAKSELNRKKSQKTALGARLSYVDEQKAVAAAERQLAEAKQKLVNVRRWSRLLDEEGFNYKGAAQGMSLAVEADVPKALAQLDNMIAALEAYAVSGMPTMQTSTAASVEAEGRGAPEVMPSMAREAPQPDDAVVEAYRRLRGRTPSRAVRDSTPITQSESEWSEAGVADAGVANAVAELAVTRTPVVADDKIVLANEAWRDRRVYLERLETAAAGDSGWYVGPADDSAVTAYEAMRAADFLAGRPNLQPVLGLPPGFLVVLDGGAVDAVLDAQDRLLWPAK